MSLSSLKLQDNLHRLRAESLSGGAREWRRASLNLNEP